MPYPRLPEAVMRESVAAILEHGSITEAARALGVPRGTLQGRYREAKSRGIATTDDVGRVTAQTCAGQPDAPTVAERNAEQLDVPTIPDELPTADELLARRKKAFLRKSAAHSARSLIKVTVRDAGPIGIMHMGDPHVDDDGTDLGLLESHVKLVNDTPGLYCGNVGDYSNNWVGRLARLYAEQSLSAREGWVLVEWLITSVNWLYLVGGNHDLWSGAGDPITWIARQAGVRYDTFGARVGLEFPNGRQIRVNARHDFKGHSQWNQAHGPSKAAQMGWRDHILSCGHKHTSGYNILKDPATGLISHAFRVASYKAIDRYALTEGMMDQAIFVAPVTIIDPRFEDNDPRCVTFMSTPEQGADFLTFLRSRKSCAA